MAPTGPTVDTVNCRVRWALTGTVAWLLLYANRAEARPNRTSPVTAPKRETGRIPAHTGDFGQFEWSPRGESNS